MSEPLLKITNIRTSKSKIALMNPNQIELNLEAMIEKKSVLATSRTNVYYKNTELAQVDIEFFISRQYLKSINSNIDVTKEFNEWVNFFMAGTFAPKQNVLQNIALDTHLLIWKNVITMECNIVRVSLPIEKFDKEGRPAYVFLTVTFQPLPDEKMKTYEHIEKYGYTK